MYFPLIYTGIPVDNATIQENLYIVNRFIEIFTGKSNKLALIIGPCSADNEDSVIDYIERLRKVQEKVSDKIFIIPRIYTNKPRTTGDGYYESCILGIEGNIIEITV